MEYHYSNMCILPDHHSGPYTSEYVPPPFNIPTRNGEYEVRSSVLVDGGDRFGVSAVAFDKYEELLWMGNQGGHVTSYYGPSMQKYTSFQVHETDEVRDIVALEHGIYILTKTILRHQIRRGLPKQTHRSKNMTDMQCLYQVNSTNLLMGGHQDKLLDLDMTTMVETVIPIKEDGCAVLRSGGASVVACGSANGMVTLRDLRTPAKAENTFRAHSACLSDLDMQGDLLLTCGFTQSVGGAVVEPYVVVWDARLLRTSNHGKGLWSIPTASPPLLLHFLPAFSGRAVAVSGDGHAALLHVNMPKEEQSVFRVDTQSSQCSVIDVSSTSQAIAFADQSGHLHLFSPSQNLEPVFNNFSRETEFADSMPALPRGRLDDEKFRFTSVPKPGLASGSKLFNELPPEFFKKVYRKLRPVDPEVLRTMKMQGPIGYAPNPGTFRRNQMPYVQDTLEGIKAVTLSETKTVAPSIPRIYQKVDTRHTKHSMGNGELENNKTRLPALEPTVSNSYCNPMLQVLYYTPPVKATLLAHSCAKEFCLSCELGFLFRTLDVSGGAPCQATKFLRAFRTVPEAAALGLILPDLAPDAGADLLAIIQSWNRFILHQIHYDILETRKKEKELVMLVNSPPKVHKLLNHVKSRNATHLVNGQYNNKDYQFTELEFLGPTDIDCHVNQDELWKTRPDEGNGVAEPVQNHINHELSNRHAEREETEITQLFAIGRHQLNRCLKCNKEEGRESVVLACALQYPHVGSREGGETRGGFADLVRASLAARRSTPAWCEQCSRFTPTTQRGRVVRLPPILAINCGGVTVREKAYWAKGTQKDMLETKRVSGNSKPCRYGLHCSRPGCHFKHPDRPGSSSTSSSKNSSPESHCVLPHQLLIRLQSDGDVIINDKVEYTPDESINRPDANKYKKYVTTHSQIEYRLTAAVVCVDDSPKNLVAYIRTPVKNSEPQWHLFNDLCISPVSADEVVQFDAWWKMPCVLFYMSTNVKQSIDDNTRS